MPNHFDYALMNNIYSCLSQKQGLSISVLSGTGPSVPRSVIIIYHTCFYIDVQLHTVVTCVMKTTVALRGVGWQITGYAGRLLGRRAGQNQLEVSLYLVAWNGIWTPLPERGVVANGASHNIL